MSDSPIFNPFDEDDKNKQRLPGYSNEMDSLDVDSGSRSLAWLIVGVAAIGCGLFFAAALFFFREDVESVYNQYFPSPTATISPTPTGTPTPNMTATQQVVQVTGTAQAIESLVAEAGSEWNVLISDSFDNLESKWITGTDEDSYATIIRSGVDQTYQWNVTSKQGFISWITANDEPLTDFQVTVEADRVEGTTSSDYGLVFREDADENFYYFGVGDDGFFISVNYEDEWIDVVDFTSSSIIEAGEVNRITVIARGSYFIFLINDVIVAEAVDDHIPSGTTALAMQVYEEGLEVTIAFDNFELRAT